MTDNRDAHTEQIAEQWRTFRKHSPTGAYLPVGQLDGDCRECGQAWPCESVTEALLPVVARIKADAAAETVAAVEAVHHRGYNSERDETWGANPVCEGCEQSWPCETITALSAGRTALDTRLAEARTEERERIATELLNLRIECPVHGIPDCGPLLNGCSIPRHIAEWRGEVYAALIARAEASGEGQ